MGKAVMFTITFFLLSTILLAVAFSLFGLSQSTEERAREIATNNRINDLSSSVSNSMAQIFIDKSGLTVAVDNSVVSIQEVVPNNNLISYSESFNTFKDFVESREYFVAIDNSSINNTRLLIMPLNGNYYSDSESKRFITNFKDLTKVTLTVYRSNISVAEIRFPAYTEGSTTFSIVLRNDTKTLTDSRNVDLNQALHIELDDSDGNAIDAEVISNLFEIRDMQDVSLNITLDLDTTEKAKIFMENTVTVNIQEFNTSKVTRPRVV